MKGRQFIECLGLYDRLHRTDLCPWRPEGPSDGLLDIESKWVGGSGRGRQGILSTQSYTWLRRILFREKGVGSPMPKTEPETTPGWNHFGDECRAGPSIKLANLPDTNARLFITWIEIKPTPTPRIEQIRASPKVSTCQKPTFNVWLS